MDRNTADTQTLLLVVKPYEFLTAMLSSGMQHLYRVRKFPNIRKKKKKTISTAMLKEGAQGGSTFLCNVGKFLPVQAPYLHRRQKS